MRNRPWSGQHVCPPSSNELLYMLIVLLFLLGILALVLEYGLVLTRRC